MFHFRFFKRECAIDLTIFLSGILMNVLAFLIDAHNEHIIGTILIGIGCSLIASSLVTFLTFLFSEKVQDIHEQAEKIGLQYLGVVTSQYLINKISHAKDSIDFVFANDVFPFESIKENENFFRELLEKGVAISILYSKSIPGGYTEELYDERWQHYYTHIIEELNTSGNINLIRIYQNMGCKWIRVDEIIYQLVETNMDSHKSLIYEFKKNDSEYAPFSKLYNDYLSYKKTGKELVKPKLFS